MGDVETAKVYITLDTIIKVIILIINIYICRKLIFGKMNVRGGLLELKANVSVGLSLMIANFLGMFIIGVSRIMVEQLASIQEFSIFSFAISISSLALVFLSAVSIVIFPILTRLSTEKIKGFYNKFTSLINLSGYIFLFLFFPLKWFIVNYIEAYSGVIIYLPLLLVIIILEAKIQLIINSYFKTLREEKVMLKSNFLSLVLFVILGGTFYYYSRSINGLVFIMLLVFLMRFYLSELYLKNKLNIEDNNFYLILKDLIILVLFLIFIYLENQFYAILSMSILYVLYVSKNISVLKYFYKLLIRRN